MCPLPPAEPPAQQRVPLLRCLLQRRPTQPEWEQQVMNPCQAHRAKSALCRIIPTCS
jgi:hypothetical protein